MTPEQLKYKKEKDESKAERLAHFKKLYEQGKMELCLAKGAFCIHADVDGSCCRRVEAISCE